VTKIEIETIDTGGDRLCVSVRRGLSLRSVWVGRDSPEWTALLLIVSAAQPAEKPKGE
jgi:hypothetical protein